MYPRWCDHVTRLPFDLIHPLEEGAGTVQEILETTFEDQRDWNRVEGKHLAQKHVRIRG